LHLLEYSPKFFFSFWWSVLSSVCTWVVLYTCAVWLLSYSMQPRYFWKALSFSARQ
jgi:hypothetical protein